jgi:enoyl-CoA hydratase
MSLETSIHGRIMVVKMARPEKRNALNREITLGIDAAMNELEDNPELWCGILTGEDTVFSAYFRPW